MTWASALVHKRGMHPIVGSKGRRLCYCGCRRFSTHYGSANGMALMQGCELAVRRWVRNPSDAYIQRRKNDGPPSKPQP